MTPLLLAALLSTPSADTAPPTFERDVKPILKKRCMTCHTAERPRGDLDVSSLAGILAGGVSGKAVVKGKPEESPLYTLAAHLEEPKMPPNAPKTPQRELDVIKNWIAGGLLEKPGDASTTGVSPTTAGGLVPAIPFARRTPITALAVSPDGQLAAVSGMTQVLVFDAAENKLLGGVPFPEGEVHTLRFTADGKTLIAGGGVGGQSGLVVGFAVGTWERAFELGDELDAVMTLDVTADGRFVAIGGPTRVVKVFAVADKQLLHTFRKPTDWVTAVRFSPDGLLVAAGDRFGGLFAWEVNSGKEFALLRGHTMGIAGLAWRADGDVLASTADDGTVRLWNMHKLTTASTFEAHADGVTAMQWVGDTIVTGGRDGHVKRWDAAGKLLGTIARPADRDEVTELATADAKTVYVADWDGRVGRWDNNGAFAELPLPIAPPAPVIAVAPVLPEALPVQPLTSPIPTAPVSIEGPLAESERANAELAAAKKMLARKSLAAAVANLRLAVAADPENPAIRKALAEAEVALQAVGN